MEKFTKVTGVAAPLPMVNIDTDKIIPKQFLKLTFHGTGRIEPRHHRRKIYGGASLGATDLQSSGVLQS